jgi:hypothetical protein
MNTSKRFLVAATFVMLTGLCAGAMAQSRTSAFLLPPEPYSDVIKVNAIRISEGTTGYDGQTKEESKFGYSFLGRTSGSLPGSFTLFLNYAPATLVPGDSSALTGGAWALPVYTAYTRLGGDGYAGSLYGSIASGKMSWDKAGTSAAVYIILNVDGGTKSWDGVKGSATFVGTLSIDDKGTTILNGEFSIEMIPNPGPTPIK